NNLGSDTITDPSNGGTDTLDFSATSAAVSMRLGVTTAQVVVSGKLTLTLGSSAIENVIGGSGNDTLIGNSLNNVLSGGGGNDSLQGGTGRDILLGGDGADNLNGSSDGDLLLAAQYSQETNATAVNALMAEWARSDATSYDDRIAHLSSGGGLNG